MIVPSPSIASACSCAFANSARNSNVPVADHSITIPMTKPRSPSLVIQNAFTAARAAIETAPAAPPARRSGATTARRTKLANGRPRTRTGSQTSASITSAPEQVEAVGLHRPPHTEDHDDDRQPQRDLGDRDRDREEREDQPEEVAVESGEGDQIDVHGVEHQFDPEQDPDRVAPREDAKEADREHERREREVRGQAHSSVLAK